MHSRNVATEIVQPRPDLAFFATVLTLTAEEARVAAALVDAVNALHVSVQVVLRCKRAVVCAASDFASEGLFLDLSRWRWQMRYIARGRYGWTLTGARAGGRWWGWRESG